MELVSYFVADLSVTANMDFSPERPTQLRIEDLRVHVDFRQQEGRPRWQIILKVQQNVGPERNSPYNFALTLVGLFDVHPSVPSDRTEQIVKVNGSSLLYGTAREILRTEMARGPHFPMLLPAVSFYPAKSAQDGQSTKAGPAAASP